MSKKLICGVLTLMLIIPFSFLFFSCKKDHKLPPNGTDYILITEEQSKAMLFNDDIEIKVNINISYNGENQNVSYLFGQKLDDANGNIYWFEMAQTKGAFKKVNDEYVYYVYNSQTGEYEKDTSGDVQSQDEAYAKCFNPVYGYLYEINDTKYNGHLTKKDDEVVCVNNENMECYTYEFYDEASVFNGKEKVVEKFFVDKTYGIIVKRTINSYTDFIGGTPSGLATFVVSSIKFGSSVISPELM